MSNKSHKGVFHKGECLDMLCVEKGPHYHLENSVNTYNFGPVRSVASSRENGQKAMLNAYVGINQKRANRENIKNAVKTWKARNRKSAAKSLKNNNRRRAQGFPTV
jgi:hypothetical protein